MTSASRTLKLSLLLLAKGLGLFSLSRALTARTPRILCYHGGSMADEHRFNAKLFMRSSTFEARVRWLKKHGFQSIDLDELVDSLAKPTQLFKRTVVFTFDDGWFSTGDSLLPHLWRHQYKSTLYLATRVFAAGTPVLDVTVNYLLWKSKQSSVRLDGFSPALDRTWNLQEPKEKMVLSAEIVSLLQTRSDSRATVDALLDKLAGALGVEAGSHQIATRRFHYLTPKELTTVAASGTRVELHGHTHHYPLNEPGKFHEDLLACFKEIAQLALPRPKHFCYPSGVHDEHAGPVLKALGVVTATTCVPSSANRAVDSSNLYTLPRFLDGEDVSMIEFEAEMSGLLHMARSIREWAR
jgi:peptidoglycan/xylan/chitin deacetylase (PgdA/CDA1 family)